MAVRTQFRPGLVAVLVTLSLALVTGACGGGDEPADDSGSEATTTTAADEALEPVAGGKLVMGIQGESDGWVPARNRWTPPGLNVARAVYDPLAAFTEEGEVVPYLAESIEPNDDYTEWVITLREGVTFHNGDPLDPDALIANLESIRQSPLLGPTFQSVQGLEATGPLEVTVTMSSPWTTFPVLIAQQPGFIVHPGMLTDEITDPVGTGPFVFDQWVPDKEFLATKNPSYWRPGLPYLEEIEFQVIPDNSTRKSALLAGDVDLMHTVDPAEFIGIEGLEAGIYGVYSPGADDENLVALNTQTGPTADIEVRRALQLATDRDALNEQLFEGGMVVADTPFDPDSKWYSDPGWPEADPDEARAIVEEWEAENGPLRLSNLGLSTSLGLQISQYLAESWEAVGIEVEIESTDIPSLTLKAVTGDFQTASFPLFNSPDPDGDYHFLDPDNIAGPGEFSLAITRYDSDTLEQNLDTGRSTLDLGERQAAYAEVWKEIAEEVPIIWLYHAPWVIEAADLVHGLDTFTLPDSDADPLLINWGSLFLTEAWVE